MTKRTLNERLDEAVEALMNDRKGSTEHLDPRLSKLLGIAADLRDLPSEAFRARLETELRSAPPIHHPSSVPASYGKPLMSVEDMKARLAELAGPPKMDAFDLQAAMSDLPELGMRFLAPLGGYLIGVSRSSGPSHWERHSGGDEMLHLLQGDADVVTLTGAGEVRSPFPAGSVFLCPKGLWHRVEARTPLSLFFATPGTGTEASEEHPLGKRRAHGSTAVCETPAPKLEAHDIGSVLAGLPELRITSDTSAAEADAAFGELATLDRCPIYVGRFHGQSPWERHSSGDELLHVLDGEVDVTVLTDEGAVHRTLCAGSVFVCPRGLWHRQVARNGATGLYATPKPTDVSFADDPRLDA